MKTDKNFKGFTIPDGTWLPPEMIDMLPELEKSHLKVLIVIIYNYLRSDVNTPTSIRDLSCLTGLAKQSVIIGINHLMERGLIQRRELGGSYVYEPRVQSLDHQVRLSKDRESPSIDSTLLDSSKLGVLKTMRSFGLYGKTARQIVADYDVETIELHIGYYQYVVDKDWAHGPGWFATSIKEDWGPPVGFKREWSDPTRSSMVARRRYADLESDPANI